jgi:ATP-dependent exoDNAse (exonuclease V) beta subunit
MKIIASAGSGKTTTILWRVKVNNYIKIVFNKIF